MWPDLDGLLRLERLAALRAGIARARVAQIREDTPARGRATRRRVAGGSRPGSRRSSSRAGRAAPRRRSTGRFVTPTAPRLPGSAPSAARHSSGRAGRSAHEPVASASFTSFSSWSPRRRNSAGASSTMYTSVLIWRSAGAPPGSARGRRSCARPASGTSRARPAAGGSVTVVGDRHRLLEVRRVAAAGTDDDPVLAGVAHGHELDRLAAAHRARRRLHRNRLDAAAREDAPVRVGVFLERSVETGAVDVERVRVLHRELAPAQHARLRPRLVAELRRRSGTRSAAAAGSCAARRARAW